MPLKFGAGDTIRCFSLVTLSIFFLPFSILLVIFCFILSLIPYYDPRHPSKDTTQEECVQETVLVTGVGMAKGLTLARAFYASGHRVIGADIDDPHIPCPGRYSRSLSAFYRLPKSTGKDGPDDYIRELINIVNIENVKLWVSCSGVTNAVQDAQAKESIEKRTLCKCIQFDVQTTSTLHDKGSFMDECKKLDLPIPETYEVRSKYDTFRILSGCVTSNPDRRYILKPVGMDDIHRGNMTILPLESEEETKHHISQLPISDSNPWILQQYIPGGKEYCTHALVIGGIVKCFLACPSSEFLMNYELLQDSALWKAMLMFTIEFVQRSPRPEAMTGHLSFDFMTSEESVHYGGFRRNIYAIECNPRAHTAAVLFGHGSPEAQDMVQAYIDAINVKRKMFITDDLLSDEVLLLSAEEKVVMPSENMHPRYWIGHDLVSLLLYPLYHWCIGSIDSRTAISNVLEFVSHMLLWKEGTFEVWDPLPAFSLYHIYWPMKLVTSWWNGNRWSRINVSTTKIFAC
ncbi:hypothetical protein F4774DRAFT_418289 [Daldinia eschscholtzii]|nr:hypothetical protein F4774DRAFT_418289 [Daldinia eschscholtzii]